MDDLETNYAELGLDYGHGKNAFEAAAEYKASRKPVELTEEQKIIARRAEEHRARNLARYHRLQAEKHASSTEPKQNAEIRKIDSLREKMKKAATRVNQPNFHINTPAMDTINSDKRRRIIGVSGGGR